MRAVSIILRHSARSRSVPRNSLFSLNYSTSAQRTMEKNNNNTTTSNNKQPFKSASLNNYFDFCLQNGPGFAINSKKIEILHDPPTFFNQLKERIQRAEKHILLASLYIGHEPKPVELVQALHTALRTQPALHVTLLLDYLRGTRNTAPPHSAPLSSVTLLLPLVQEFPDRVRCHLFHTPALNGVLKRLLPQRWNEVIGVQHVKCYIVDHVLCISGANLSEQYFTARQDRYMWLHSAALSTFYRQLIDTIGQYSYLLGAGGLVLAPGTPDPATQSEAFKLFANQKMKLFLDTYRITRADHAEELVEELSASSEVRNNSSRDQHYSVLFDQDHSAHDTWIFPTIQMGALTIDHDLKVTARVIQDAPPHARLYLTSPYFNFTDKYTQLMLESRADIQIIVASPEANGFWKGSGMSGYIPHAYSKVLQEFFNRVNRHGQQHRIELYEYFRNAWTFHAKGLWISLPEDVSEESRDKESRDDLPSLTMIGSPNFGVRSVVRDFESQLLIMTENPAFKQELKRERDNIFNNSVQVKAETFDEEQRQGGWWVRLLIPLAKKYM